MPNLARLSDPFLSLFRSPNSGESTKFGTFNGVFLPTLLTILGAVMYLRTGWVVGNAGLWGGILIITLANTITLCTGLSISSVATNIRVRAGGAFSIISQSLGLEVGGSVTMPFYLAQAISVAFYIFAFSEGWQRIFPSHPAWLIVFVAFGLCFAIAYFSINLAARVRFPILFLVIFSLLVVFLGSFERFGPGFTVTSPAWGNFPSADFWGVFAVFFPAVTGVLAGVNMSGTLRDPRKSIPTGTLAAILLSFAIYLGLAYWVSRVATPEELVTTLTVMVDKSAWGPAVLAGILAATFSAALNSLVGAPRVLQAIAEHGILPGGEILAQETLNGEPRPAMIATGIVGLATIFFGLAGGGLNAIAPLMTMFFLITYAVLNGVVLVEQSMGLVSFRPVFKIPRIVPLIGLVGSLYVMFLINAIFSLVALVVTILLYSGLTRRRLTAPWSDVRSGIFVSLAEWAAMQILKMPETQERAWKPSLLVPVQTRGELLGSYRFIKDLTYPKGSVHVLGMYSDDTQKGIHGLEELVDAFATDGIFARSSLLKVENFAQGMRTGLELLHSVFFRPNALFMYLTPHTDAETLQFVLEQAQHNEIGAILYAKHPQTSLGREQTVNVWIRDQSPDWEVGMRLTNLDLSLLLAYQLVQNWHGQMNLITVVQNEDDRFHGQIFLDTLVRLGRMPRNTRTIVAAGSLAAYLPDGPQADLNIFGLQTPVDLHFMHRMVEQTDASCIFVRDSGHESALA
ncbi:MAG: hypothetical protein KJZ86_07895 [Caldilineaceae bacterium]|nr:hypothetical protein [Caldilineaceae bacterium]